MKNIMAERNTDHVDYKDVELLKKFLNPHARMISRKKSGISSKQQRALSSAVKRARFMAFIPYVSR